MLAEVLDDDLGLLGEVMRMQADEPRDRPARLLGVVLRVFLRRLLDLPEGLVRRVVREHVHDEALFDGLPHRVEVEGLVDLGLRIEAPEHLQRPALRSGGEGEVREIWLAPAARADRLRERLLDGIDRH